LPRITSGQSVLITDQGGFAGSNYATYLRNADESAPVRLGEGQALDFSPDSRSVLSLVYGPPSRLLLLPIGAGQTMELPNPDGLTISVGAFLPDGKRVAFLGSKGTAAFKGYVQAIADGSLRAFTAEGVNTSGFSALAIAPAGTSVWLIGTDENPALFPLEGGAPRPLAGILPRDVPVAWTADGKQLYVSPNSSATQRIFRVDLATGVRTLWREVVPSQPAGVRLAQVLMTPDTRTMLHGYSQLLPNLYVVTGVDSAR
jgi:hypothetical protein